MVTSVANVAGAIASLLLSALVMCFNMPRFVSPEVHASGSTQNEHARHDGISGFHATATVEDAGHGDKRLTVSVDFGPNAHDEDEGL